MDGNKVATRYTMRGTHKGGFMGVPATGNQVEVKGISIYQVDDGKITAERGTAGSDGHDAVARRSS